MVTCDRPGKDPPRRRRPVAPHTVDSSSRENRLPWSWVKTRSRLRMFNPARLLQLDGTTIYRGRTWSDRSNWSCLTVSGSVLTFYTAAGCLCRSGLTNVKSNDRPLRRPLCHAALTFSGIGPVIVLEANSPFYRGLNSGRGNAFSAAAMCSQDGAR